NEKCFANMTSDGGRFQYFNGTEMVDYEADYIAAVSNDTINLNARLADYFNSPIIKFSLSDTNLDLRDDNFIKITENTNGDVNLLFKEGTYSEGNNYRKVYVCVEDQTYTDILTKAETGWVSIELTFFIYEPIEEKDLVLKLEDEEITKPITRYLYEYMGAYYIDLSSANLSIDMEENLWNYTQHQEQKDTYIIGNDGEHYKTVWRTPSVNDSQAVETENQTDNAISLRFSAESSTYTIYAYVKQFNTIYTRTCNITVKKPVLSTGVIVKSVLSSQEGKTYKIDTAENGEHVLNLKAGEQCQIVGTTVSSEGEQVTHPEIAVVVVDKLGTYVDSNVVYVDHDTNTIKVANNFTQDEFKILVFAKDVLTMRIIRDDKSRSFAVPESWLLGYNSPDEEIRGKYIHAYQTITLKLSDGTKEHPYYIYDAEDLLEINNSEEMKTKYYCMGSSIDLNGTTAVFDNFSGTIDTYTNEDNEHEIMTIAGVQLTATHKNLFTNFSGTINNVKFVVDYDVDLIADNTTKIGVFDVNNGTLENVSVEYSGEIKVNNTTTTYVGGLVAENNGVIKYTKQINGANYTSTIEVSGDGVVKFGGLVGLNNDGASIVGYYKEKT
ncbi:MAG: hypothetical protein MJ152_03515, partial [Clostridia bacterium]|nr:hypothetical protein [Clostridia bacterium]